MAYAQSWESDSIPQLHRSKTAALHSDIGEAQSISPHAAQYVIRKITMTVGYGNIETHVHVSAWDWADIGGRELLQMRFTFRDGRGAVIDAQGLQTLFSLVVHAPEI